MWKEELGPESLYPDLYFLFLNAVITDYWHVFCPCPLVSLCCIHLSNFKVVYLLMSLSETFINTVIIIIKKKKVTIEKMLYHLFTLIKAHRNHPHIVYKLLKQSWSME